MGLFAVELSTTYPDSNDSSEKNSNETDTVINAVRQVIKHTKTKLRDMIDQITHVMSELFKLVGSVSENDRSAGVAVAADSVVEGKLRASFMLCIVVLLIVVVSRARGAS